jgi:hypothetical protein
MTIVVSTTDKKEVLGEQKGIREGEPEIGHIAEMVTNPAKLADFGFSTDVIQKAERIKLDCEDDKPEFPVVRVEEGWSGSGRLWDGQEVESIVRQTNTLEPVGHLGHIPDDQAAFSFPEPQTTWIGAIAKTEPSEQKERTGEMVTVAYFAGYNLPGAKIRGIRKGRAVRGISWWGDGDIIPIPGRGVQVRNFSLKALDWARKLAEGMPTSRIVAMAREMKEETQVADLALAQVTPEQYKTENPNGYTLLVNEAVAEKDTKIGEMQKEIDKGKEREGLLSKACELLGIENPGEIVTKIEEMKKKVGDKAKATVATHLESILKERIPGEDDDADVIAKRALVRRLLPVAEMETKVSDVKEDEAKEKIGEMVTSAIDSDSVIKAQIGEQAPPVVRRREELRSGDKLDSALKSYGVERERVTLG